MAPIEIRFLISLVLMLSLELGAAAIAFYEVRGQSGRGPSEAEGMLKYRVLISVGYDYLIE